MFILVSKGIFMEDQIFAFSYYQCKFLNFSLSKLLNINLNFNLLFFIFRTIIERKILDC